MDSSVVAQLLDCFKAIYGIRVRDAGDLFAAQRDILQFVIELGRELEEGLFAEIGKGYEGARIERGGKRYRFVAYRAARVHGLFGRIGYERAYYAGMDGSGSYIPLDERLGIEKEHTPAMQYFLSTFTARGAYVQSLNHFHEIFRPAGKDLVSMRKALDMDYELGSRLEAKRQREVQGVFEQDGSVAPERPIEGMVAVSVDATKLREKLGERVNADGGKSYEIGFRDAKIGSVSAVGWDKERGEAYCQDSSYVVGIEHADQFFQRLWVEMKRRMEDPEHAPIVFIADGASWIWDRIGDVANSASVLILDFYHACKHLSDMCKRLYGEETPAYWQHFKRWKKMLYGGKVLSFLAELKEIRDGPQGSSQREFVQDELKYFERYKDRMHYDRYRAMKLPIGSGTIESSCKNVIGGRMKQGGMTWSPTGADGMLQIRASQASGRLLDDFTSTLPRAA